MTFEEFSTIDYLSQAFEKFKNIFHNTSLSYKDWLERAYENYAFFTYSSDLLTKKYGIYGIYKKLVRDMSLDEYYDFKNLSIKMVDFYKLDEKRCEIQEKLKEMDKDFE